MSSRDFKISFTWTVQPEQASTPIQGNTGASNTIFYLNPINPQDVVGANSTIFGDLAAFKGIGASNTVFIDVVAFNNPGSSITFLASGIFIPGIADNIIHYAEDSEIRADRISLEDSELFAGDAVGTIRIENVRRHLNDRSVGGTIDINDSWSVNINTSAVANITLTLPDSPSVGANYTFVNSNQTYTISVEPGSGDLIGGFNLVTLNAIGSKLSVVYNGSTWLIVNKQNITGA